MRYLITKNGDFVNAVEAEDLDFVKTLCAENGWDFAEDPLPDPPPAPPEPDPEPSEEADMMQMLLDQEYRLTMLELTAGTAEI